MSIGNHLKMDLPRELRERARQFYVEVLGCRVLPSPQADLDLFEFEGGWVLGLFFSDGPHLPEEAYLRATWMELKTADPEALEQRLLAFGVREVAYPDPTRFFFQAPGGQVFRVAPIEGGL